MLEKLSVMSDKNSSGASFHVEEVLLSLIRLRYSSHSFRHDFCTLLANPMRDRRWSGVGAPRKHGRFNVNDPSMLSVMSSSAVFAELMRRCEKLKRPLDMSLIIR